MSAMGELASHLAEYGGRFHTHDGWIARDSRDQLADGYRYAIRERHTCGPECGRVCCGWHWRYVGRAFVDVDAPTVLAELVRSILWTSDGRIAAMVAAGGMVAAS